MTAAARTPVSALRAVLMAIGAAGLLVVGSVLLAGFIVPGLVTLAMLFALMLFGLAFERWRYKRPLAAPPSGPGWVPTTERFVDTESGRPTTVWVRAGTGERAYVEDGGGGPEDYA